MRRGGDEEEEKDEEKEKKCRKHQPVKVILGKKQKSITSKKSANFNINNIKSDLLLLLFEMQS